MTQSPRQVFETMLLATRQGAWDDMVDLFHPDVLIEMPFAPPGVPRSSRGREELRSRMRGAAVTAERTEVVAIHETPDPEVIVAEWILQGAVAKGRHFRTAYLMVTRVREGLIVSSRDYADALSLALALDRLPALVAAYEDAAPGAGLGRADRGTGAPPSPGFDPRPLFGRQVEAAGRADWDAFAGLWAEDGVMEYPFPLPGLPSRLDGREAIRAQYAAIGRDAGASPNSIRDPLVHATLDPEVFLVEYDIAGVDHRGRPFQQPFAAVVRVREGAFVSYRDYTDVLAIMTVRGKVPELVAATAAGRD